MKLHKLLAATMVLGTAAVPTAALAADQVCVKQEICVGIGPITFCYSVEVCGKAPPTVGGE